MLVISYTSPGAASELGVGDIESQLVERLDCDIARIDQELTSQDMRRSTALIITSSIAPLSGQRSFKGNPGQLYEGGLRVPLLIRWPDRVAAGLELAEPFGMWDLMPTLAAMSGAQRRPAGLDGVNMLPFLGGRPQRPLRRILYWESRGEAGLAQAVRMGDWKAIRRAGHVDREDVELYNLADDPRESTDVSKQFPKILAAFLKKS